MFTIFSTLHHPMSDSFVPYTLVGWLGISLSSVEESMRELNTLFITSFETCQSTIIRVCNWFGIQIRTPETQNRGRVGWLYPLQMPHVTLIGCQNIGKCGKVRGSYLACFMGDRDLMLTTNTDCSVRSSGSSPI